ncbi:MAG: heme-binding protein [Ignavibacteriae bacterium]|nr:heme-binding protein [Ignavibacteriota bacterium]
MMKTITVYILSLLTVCILWTGCDVADPAPAAGSVDVRTLDSADVRRVVAQAVQTADGLAPRRAVAIAVTDREGNELAVFLMDGLVDPGDTTEARAKARTASYLSSNQNSFSTLTASFITRPHFPPGIANTPAGPLFGVGFSSLPGGDIQPNGGALNDRPGGIPLYKDGILVGGIGIAGAGAGFDTTTCEGITADEVIAVTAARGFEGPARIRGDQTLAGGIRLLYTNAIPASVVFVPGFDERTRGVYTFRPAQGGAPVFPIEGEVTRGGVTSFAIRGSGFTTPPHLSAAEVRGILTAAAAQAGITRAAIRQPVGVPARVFIAVVDRDGRTVLGVWRTREATLFSFDVAVQKARTALAFSDPANTEFGARVRGILGLASDAGLAMTTRAVGFLAQDFYPPGIDRSTLGVPQKPGPLYQGPGFQYQRSLLRPGLPAYGNGITIFPGGIPLYRNGVLIGAIGVSGDGVDQDDLIAAAGARGYDAPSAIRSDAFFYDGVRLPFVKFPRKAEL